MRVRAMTAMVATAALALTGALVATASLTTATAVPPVLSISGSLTERGTGMPAAGVPATQRIRSATVTVSPGTDRARATVVLRAAPGASDNARLRLMLGKYDNNGTCAGIAEYDTETHATTANSGWSRSGTTYTLDKSFDLYGGHILTDDLNCAFALVTLNDINNFRDLLGGSLKPKYAATKLKITGAKLLGKKKLKLLPKEWISIDVTVKNVGAYETSGLKVSGKGKGVKVKTGKTATWIQSGSTLTVPVKVKLTKKKAKIKLTTQAIGTKKATKKITVKPARAPKRIKNGNYRTSDKRVTFRVKKGKITQFKLTEWALCSYTADHWATYTMANVKVPKSGIVQVQQRLHTNITKLAGRATGKKVKATFAYMGGGCMANKTFTAKRVGK